MRLIIFQTVVMLNILCRMCSIMQCLTQLCESECWSDLQVSLPFANFLSYDTRLSSYPIFFKQSIENTNIVYVRILSKIRFVHMHIVVVFMSLATYCAMGDTSYWMWSLGMVVYISSYRWCYCGFCSDYFVQCTFV